MKTRHRYRNIRRNKTRNTKSKNNKSRKLHRGGFLNFFNKGTNANTNVNPTTPDATQEKEKKQYGNLFDAASVAAQRSAKSWNMPAMLGAINTKLNALLVGNNINYEFSNGYNARDYDMTNSPGTAENDGRGQLKPTAKRGKITGFQSKIYNMTTDSKTYNKGKQHFDNIKQKYSN